MDLIMMTHWFNYINLMGNSQKLKKLNSYQRQLQSTTTLGKTYSGQDSVWQQEVEIHHCCGIKMQKIKRKKIIWENLFIDNCNSIANQFQWANDLIELVNNCELAKTKYFNQVHALKNEVKSQTPKEMEILQTAAEVETFKSNLKRSVIMSFSTAKPSVVSNNQKIAGIMDTTSRLSRISIQRASYLNKQAAKNSIRYNRENTVGSKGGFRESIISLIDDTISSVMGSEREITKQSAKDLELFLKFSMILQRHLSDINCMLGRIKRLFIVYVEKTFRNRVEASLKIGDFIDHIKQFLALLRETVIDYYNLPSFVESDQQKSFIANEENILSACTAILFKEPVFYQQTFEIVNNYNKARQIKFALIVEHFKDRTPEQFMVKDRFCLNAKTIQTYISSLNQDENSIVESIEFKQMTANQSQPYKICMDQLKELQKTRSPISKMKVIVTVSQSITTEIQKFYQKNGLRKQKWMLDADQILSIFCYIIVGARVQNLISHLFVLQNFATSHQMISMSGYYHSVLNCAVEQLQSEYDKQMLASL